MAISPGAKKILNRTIEGVAQKPNLTKKQKALATQNLKAAFGEQ